jgi:hypothetical protein
MHKRPNTTEAQLSYVIEVVWNISRAYRQPLAEG